MRLDTCVAGLPEACPGPGGAVAVIKDGAVRVRHTWGYANMERRIRFTPQTLFRICSITKQFTCGLMLDQFPDPSVLDASVAARLPHVTAPPEAIHLCHNQSGLRDYWAVAMLHGAAAESAFGETEARQVIGGTRSLHFTPGTRYSYCNQNYRLLSDALESRTGRSFAELLRTRLFGPAGMDAILAADTRALPDGTEGYEGSVATGFRPAVNRVLWTGDAGIGASLDDMIGWERWIDRTREDGGSLYRRLSAPVAFADGAPAAYGFGLARGTAWGRATTGHGGALRGWRSHRVHVAAERLSVVVLFNHMADARAAAMTLLGAALDEPAPATPPAASITGTYIEPETTLAVRIDEAAGMTRLRYGPNPEFLAPGGTRLWADAAGIWMERAEDNQRSMLHPCEGRAARDFAGRFRCAELGADLVVEDAGGALYGGFSGFLGQGRMEMLEPIGPDLWALPCPRALDHTPPGDWTLAVRREPDGVAGITVGCWLARGLSYSALPI